MNELVKRVAKNLAGRLECMPDDAGCVEHPARAWDTGYGLCGVAVMLAEDAITTMQVPSIDREKLIDSIADELETDDGIAEEWSNGKLNATARRLVEFAVIPALSSAAPVLDEGKIAEAVCRGMNAAWPPSQFSCEWFTHDHEAVMITRAVVEALGGGGEESGSCAEHRPTQHRDRKEPWCNRCGLTASWGKPRARGGAR